MKTFSKITALTLSIAMIVASMFTAVAFADGITFTDVAEDNQYSEAIYSLVEDGIINGYAEEDGTSSFKPANTITRAEFAKLLSMATAKGVEFTATTDRFPDVAVDHWANVYIAAAVGTGAINGYEDGTFRPENPVSYGEAVKMIVCTLGYGNIVTPTEPWYDGYIAIANKISLTKNAGGVGSNEAPRGLVAQLIYNISKAKTLVQSGTDSSGKPVYKTSNEDDDVIEDSGVVTTVFDVNIEGKESSLKKTQIKINDIVYDIGEMSIDKMYSYLGKSVDFEYEDTVKRTILSIKLSKNSEITIDGKDIGELDGKKLTYYDEDNDEKTINLASDLYIIYNGEGVERQFIDSDLIKRCLDIDCGEVRFLNNDSNSDYDVAFITKYETIYVTNVSTQDNGNTIKAFDTYGPIKEMEFKKNNSKLYKVTTKGGSKTAVDWSASVIPAKSVVSYAAPLGASSDDTIEVVISTVKVTGAQVTDIDMRRNETTLGSKDVYGMSDYYLTLSDIDADKYAFDVDDTGTFYLDYKGRIAYFSETESSDPYAYLVTVGSSSGGGLSGTYEVQLFTDKGTVVNYPIKDTGVKINGEKFNAVEAMSVLSETAAIINNGKKSDITIKADYSQLIKYKTNTSGGTTYISDIYTINPEDQTSGDIIPVPFKAGSKTEKEPFFTGDKLTYDSASKTFKDGTANQFTINSSTIIFLIPDDRSDTDSYKKKTYGYFSDKGNYAVEPYDLTSTTAKVVVLYACGTSSAASIDVGERCMFVAGISSASNSEGDSVRKLSYYYAGDDPSAKEPSTILTTKKARGVLDDISAGDIIKVARENGEVVNVQKVFVDGTLYSYKGVFEPIVAEDYYFSKDSSSKKNYYQVIQGVVHSIDVESNSISIVSGLEEDYDEDGWQNFTLTSSTIYYKWDSKAKEYTKEAGESILPAAESTAFDASKVVAIVVDGKVTAVYIIG